MKAFVLVSFLSLSVYASGFTDANRLTDAGFPANFAAAIIHDQNYYSGFDLVSCNIRELERLEEIGVGHRVSDNFAEGSLTRKAIARGRIYTEARRACEGLAIAAITNSH